MLPTTIAEHCRDLSAPRGAFLREHRLLDSVTIARGAGLAGADRWVEGSACGRTREAWLRRLLELPHGIPAHAPVGRVFAPRDPAQFAAGVASWVRALPRRLPLPAAPAPGAPPPTVRAGDGKQLRRSHDHRAGHPARHRVSVWACAARLGLAQEAVADPCTAITARPRLLDHLDRAGGLVTRDARGCQRGGARPLIDHQADYVRALQATQEGTYEAAVDPFSQAEADPCAGMRHDHEAAVDTGHGRLQGRRGPVSDDPAMRAGLDPDRRWAGVRARGRIHAHRPVGEALSDVETRS
jgi:predicted transposase YbfD/YdcC